MTFENPLTAEGKRVEGTPIGNIGTGAERLLTFAGEKHDADRVVPLKLGCVSLELRQHA